MKQYFLSIIILFATLLILISGQTGNAYGSPFRGPWENQGKAENPRKQINNQFNPIRSLVKLYRNYISPIDGKECPMYPSCSKYSLQCFEKHGLFMGWVMTCDRLLHEADEMRNAPLIYVNGAERFYDPLENNNFWWHNDR